MFFFVLTSQSVGSPFAFDTIFRSGAPPHIGQSPVPGSDAERRAVAPAATKTKPTTTQRRKGAKKPFFMLFIGGQFQVVDVSAELSIYKEPRRTFAVADRIRLVDLPRRGFRLACRPRLAARA